MTNKDRQIDEIEEAEDFEERALPDPMREGVVDPQVLLQQMTTMLQAYQREGLVIQRADGSFMIPGTENPLQAEVDRIGSLCECTRCLVHDQQHWRCVTCFQKYEWATQSPVGKWALGVMGRGGMVLYAVCSQGCGQAFLARKRIRPGTTTPVHERAGDMPATLGQAQIDFYLSGADT